ncbi:beta-galactosidase [Cohnella luojiensis]|uniref:Beta-galactosidase n=1 Tax=Cohnella luojiensis TaxID=652876 RepID=A0A4Y8LT75_9BACL|nr:beta-galactosidase [Cohnella luojiensis]TFE24727.1 beta-galactosidase [Cohnella luojiensis]
MYLGVDYYPDYWPEELVEEDLEGIARLGANIVRIGEFAWHRMEPREGEFDFSFFNEIVRRAKEKGLAVMFGTPTATFPAWLAKKHPTILSEDENGSVRVFGGRRQYCFNSAEYREYSGRITRKLVEHYRSEPSIISWQIDNELGHEGSDMCYCGQCHSAFQKFLQDKYIDIDALNETYGTIFWGQTYNGFDEIPIPKKTITTHNPSLQLDWARFRSRSVNGYAEEMAAIVRASKGEHQTVTTNVSGGFFGKWFDHAEQAEALDFVSYDNYPVWGGLAEPITPAAIALGHDFNRGLKGKNFWIVEELMGAQGHDVIGYLPRPNQAKMWSFQAFAHGCSDMLYFCWRSMNRGAEQFCLGIVDHDNQQGRKYKEAQSVFTEIAPYADLLQTEIKAEVAVLYDYDNVWSWRSQRQSEAFDFTNELLRLYDPFFRLNCAIDVIPANRDFSEAGYKVLLIPALQIVDERLAGRLEAFAAAGGTVVFSFRTGLRDKNNNVYFGRPFPGTVATLCGVRVEASEALSIGRSVPIVREAGASQASPPAAEWPARSSCEVWRDLLLPTTADVLYRYEDPFFSEAAVTRNSYGQGDVYYVGGGLAEDVLDALAQTIVNAREICHIESEPGVEVYARGSEYWFVLNHTPEEKSFRGTRLPPYASFIMKAEAAGRG